MDSIPSHESDKRGMAAVPLLSGALLDNKPLPNEGKEGGHFRMRDAKGG